METLSAQDILKRNMDIRIEITGDLNVRKIPANAERGEIIIRSQEAYIHKPGKKYPEQTQYTLDENDQPLPLGYYVLDLSDSITTGQYGSLQFVRYLKLVPEPKKAA